MKDNRLKIFLSYHKNTPCYKSDIFQPIQVGAENSKTIIDFAIPDNSNDNISYLNPYYCELTGHYWVLKNYLPICDEEYIGFAHYRRLPDLLNISDKDYPSIYGMSYSESLTFFEGLNNQELYEHFKDFDIIYPCSCYMYKNTVNPELRRDEANYNVFEHFLQEHNSDLLTILQGVIDEDYPEFKSALSECYNSQTSHFYNIYIMKTCLMKEFLQWQFDVLDKLAQRTGGWEQDKYLRMAGFVGEALINVWVNYKKNLKTGYVPVYMIDFEADYINNVNYYHSIGDYELEVEELKKLLDITSDKFQVLLTILKLYVGQDDLINIKKYLEYADEQAKTSEQFFELAYTIAQCDKLEFTAVTDFYTKSLESDNPQKIYAQSFLYYAENTHNISLIEQAWDYMKRFGLDDNEKEKYERFKLICEKLNNPKIN